MKQLLLIVAASIASTTFAAPMKTIDLTKRFRSQEINADDGSYKILIPLKNGQVPAIKVENSIATCKLTRGPKTDSKMTLFLEMETQRDDGLNGCELTFGKGRQKVTVFVGYSIDE